MPQQLNIHIIGGCMLGQKALGLSNLFYRKYTAQLQQEFGLQATVRLDGHNDFDTLPSKAENITPVPGVPQVLIIQLRPGLIFRRCNLLVPAKKKGLFPFQWNPYITGASSGVSSSAEMNLSDQEMGAVHMTGKLQKILATINALAGMLAGFHRKGSRQIADLLIQTADRCTQQHIQLLVIGCVNSYQNKLISIQYKAVNKLLRQYLQQKGIHYIDVFPAMEAKKAAGELLFLEDNYHLSTAGHAVLAEELYRASSKTFHALTSL